MNIKELKAFKIHNIEKIEKEKSDNCIICGELKNTMYALVYGDHQLSFASIDDICEDCLKELTEIKSD